MKFKEIEFKYNADDISLDNFNEFCRNRKPIKDFIAAGYDYFYTNPNYPDHFGRHRVGINFNQLTSKNKISDKNNFIRYEDNIMLSNDVTPEQVESFYSRIGFTKTATAFKTCFIYEYADHILVYYVLYNAAMKETGRFFEIEIREDVSFESEDFAWNRLVAIEKECEGLGITPQRRVRKSIYEMLHG